MTTNKLQLNDTKTETMIALSKRMCTHSSLLSFIHIENADVPFVSSEKHRCYPGFKLQHVTTHKQHLQNCIHTNQAQKIYTAYIQIRHTTSIRHTYKSGTSVLYGIHTNQAHQFYTVYIQIRHISSIRYLLTTPATQTLVGSLVLSRLDHCTSLLSGCPQYLPDKLQTVQNAAARLVCKAKKSNHVQPILKSVHWLPVTHRIQYKISTICFKSLSCKSPQYLSDLKQPYSPTGKLRSASDTRTFVIPRVNTKLFGERSFSHTDPSVWNNLPRSVRHSDSSSSVKTALKTHFFFQNGF